MFEQAELIVVTTAHNLDEVREYLPEFAARYALAEEFLTEVLALLPIDVYSEEEYASEVAAAKRFMGGRDDDDIALAALALKLRIPIWSNDRDYENFAYGTFTTAMLLKALGV